eukprot:Hpha_TRINITY_DN26776_c0_g1::TRINITY_DN26776_c0_g1_i1::g.138969::m.138969
MSAFASTSSCVLSTLTSLPRPVKSCASSNDSSCASAPARKMISTTPLPPTVRGRLSSPPIQLVAASGAVHWMAWRTSSSSALECWSSAASAASDNSRSNSARASAFAASKRASKPASESSMNFLRIEHSSSASRRLFLRFSLSEAFFSIASRCAASALSALCRWALASASARTKASRSWVTLARSISLSSSLPISSHDSSGPFTSPVPCRRKRRGGDEESCARSFSFCITCSRVRSSDLFILLSSSLTFFSRAAFSDFCASASATLSQRCCNLSHAELISRARISFRANLSRSAARAALSRSAATTPASKALRSIAVSSATDLSLAAGSDPGSHTGVRTASREGGGG